MGYGSCVSLQCKNPSLQQARLITEGMGEQDGGPEIRGGLAGPGDLGQAP